MEFFEVLEKRRSIRKFTKEQVPDSVIEKALDAALLAPNSSNTQTWDFYWVKSESKKQQLAKICLSQSAAREADHFLVITADPKLWRRSQQALIDFVESVNAPKAVKMYYAKLIPFVYRWGFLNIFAPVKFLLAFFTGLFAPITRGPYSRRDSQEVAIKSAALAAENFVLAISAQGYSTCMMEGFDEWRLSRMLSLSCSSRVVVVIAIGKEAERGNWGPRFRIPKEKVIHVL